ncbi:hypothetical protein NYE80_06625 [Paenibacillus sp. FSL H7-0357]|jgi:hypothetical protein|nr:hypothetical protein [Paenibacillus sp. FSL H7-0357]
MMSCLRLRGVSYHGLYHSQLELEEGDGLEDWSAAQELTGGGERELTG